MDQLREAEIGTSVMRRDTYKVLTSYIKNEKKKLPENCFAETVFFCDYDFLPVTANVLTVFRLTVNRLRDIRDPPYGTLVRNSAGC